MQTPSTPTEQRGCSNIGWMASTTLQVLVSMQKEQLMTVHIDTKIVDALEKSASQNTEVKDRRLASLMKVRDESKLCMSDSQY
jgi:hypothetical protein